MLPADSPFASPPTPGPHPATAELRAYAAGTLNPADEHRLEAHTLDCERCAELLEGFLMSDAATTDQALAGLRTRLQARVGQPEPVAGGWAWPRVAGAAVLLAAVGTGIWGWEQHEAHPPATARVETTAPAAAAGAPRASSVAKAPTAATMPETPATAGLARVAATRPAAATAGQAAYAVAAPVRRSSARRRLVPPAATEMERVGQGQSAVLTAPAATADQPNEPVLANAPAAPALSGRSTPAARAAADTVPALGEVAVASRMMKAKAAPASPAAVVANTPMPAAVAIAPAPVAGTPALNAYLRREAAKFAPEEEAKPLNGAVRLRFIVGADGKLSNLQVVRSMRADYDEEALRLVCEGPAWRPGITGGRRTALPVEITVSF